MDVRVMDLEGNLCTTDNSTEVTLGLPETQRGTLSGATKAVAVAGIAKCVCWPEQGRPASAVSLRPLCHIPGGGGVCKLEFLQFKFCTKF